MLKIENLNKKIKIKDKEISILHDINLVFPKKGMFFIKGKSGSGKTTFLNILEGLDFDYEGTIYLNDKKLKKNKKFISGYLRGVAAILFQDYNLNLKETVFDNILDGLMISGCNYKQAKEKISSLLKKYNFEHLSNKKCLYLSGGEKQRIAFIRAIAKDFKILFCDEPTGALDIKNATFLMDEIKQISKEKLVIIVSHNEELINKYADKVYELKNGTFVEQTTSFITLKSEQLLRKKSSNLFLIFLKDAKYSLKSSILVFGSLTFAFILLIGTCVLKGESENIKTSIYSSFINSNSCEISYQVPYNTKGDVIIYSEERPSIDQLEQHQIFNNFYLDLNFDYIFSSFVSVKDLDLEEIQFYPILGENFYVNQSFYSKVNEKEFTLSFNIDLFEYIENELVTDSLQFNYSVEAISYDEFSFNLAPRIYYPYLIIKDIFKSKLLLNLSIKKNSDCSLYDFISSRESNDPISSYSLVGFETNSKLLDVDAVNKKLKNSNLVLMNDMNDLSAIYSDTLNSLLNYFLMLIVICFVGIIFIIEFKLYENIQQSKKRIKIYEFQGMEIEDVKNIKVLQTFLLCLISFLIAFIINICVFSILKSTILDNFKINISFEFNSLISTLNGTQFYIFVFLLISGIILLGSLIPLNYLKKIDIKKELNSLWLKLKIYLKNMITMIEQY